MTFGRSLRRGAIALLLLVASSQLQPAALAQETSAPAIAIIDMQQILRESAAVRSMQAERERFLGSYQGSLLKMEEEIRHTQQELQRQRSVLSAEAYTKKRLDLEREIAGLQRGIKEQRRVLDAAFGRGMDQVRLVLVEVVKEIAQQRGADLVLTKANVVLVRPDLEITELALEGLNRRLPSVTLDLPQSPELPQN